MEWNKKVTFDKEPATPTKTCPTSSHRRTIHQHLKRKHILEAKIIQIVPRRGSTLLAQSMYRLVVRESATTCCPSRIRREAGSIEFLMDICSWSANTNPRLQKHSLDQCSKPTPDHSLGTRNRDPFASVVFHRG